MKNLIRKYIAVNCSLAVISGLKMPIFYLVLLDKNFDLLQIGVLTSIAAISTVVFQVPFGSLADIIGRKKVFLLGQLATIFYLVVLLSARFEWIAFSMFLTGVSRALISGSLDALFVEQYNQIATFEERHLFMSAQSKIFSASAIGLGFSTAIAGFIPMWFSSFTEINIHIGYYDMNFILMLILTCLHILFTSLLIKESTMVKLYEKKSYATLGIDRLIEMKNFIIASLKFVRCSPLILALFLLQFVNGATFMSLNNLWQPRLAELVSIKNEIWLFGLLSSLSFFSMAIGQRLASRISAFFKDDYAIMLLVIQGVMGLCFIFLGNVKEVVLFYLFYMAILMLTGLSMAPLLTVFHKNIEENSRSTLLSVQSICNQAGATGGALAGGFIAAHYGIASAWLVMAIMLLASCTIYLQPEMRKNFKEMAMNKN